jgi:hypothetical protein
MGYLNKGNIKRAGSEDKIKREVNRRMKDKKSRLDAKEYAREYARTWAKVVAEGSNTNKK